MAQRCEPQGMGRRTAERTSKAGFRHCRRSAPCAEVANALGDLSPLKSVGLHKLKRDREGQWAMTVNGPWRICFGLRRGDAHNVELVNYHKS
jgi:proteic killer suppression protein